MNLVITKEHIRYIKSCIRCFGERDDDKAEDITSDVLVQLTRRPIPDNGRGSFGLVRFIARQVFISKIKKVSGSREHTYSDIEWSRHGVGDGTEKIIDKIDREKIYGRIKQNLVDVYELKRQGMHNPDIAEQLGMSRQYVSVILSKCERAGLPPINDLKSGAYLKKENFRYMQVYDLRQSGKTVKEISKALNIPTTTVANHLRYARHHGMFVSESI